MEQVIIILVRAAFWFLSPNGRMIQAQRAQHNNLQCVGLKARLQWIMQHAQWVKDIKKVKKDKF